MRFSRLNLLAMPVLSISQLQIAVGVMGWLGSMLWAAPTQGLTRLPVKISARQRKGLMFRKQVQHAAKCLLAMIPVKQQVCSFKKSIYTTCGQQVCP